jgi:hypothetical protein
LSHIHLLQAGRFFCVLETQTRRGGFCRFRQMKSLVYAKWELLELLNQCDMPFPASQRVELVLLQEANVGKVNVLLVFTPCTKNGSRECIHDNTRAAIDH